MPRGRGVFVKRTIRKGQPRRVFIGDRMAVAAAFFLGPSIGLKAMASVLAALQHVQAPKALG